MSADDDFFDDNELASRAQSKDYRSFKELVSLHKPAHPRILFSLGLLLLGSLVAVGSSFLLGYLVQTAFVDRDLVRIGVVSISIIAAEVLQIGLTYLGRHVMASATSETIFVIRAKLFDHLARLPMRFFDKQPLGRTVTRMTHDVEGIEDFFSGTLARLLSAVITLFVVLTTMIVADVSLGLIILVSISPAIFVTFAIRTRIRYLNREMARKSSAINARLSELLNGLQVIRSFGAERWSKGLYDERVNDHLDTSLSLNIANAWSRPVILALCYVPLVALLWFGSREVIVGSMSIGLFVSFVRFCERLSRPVASIAQEIHMVQQAFTSAERVATFLRHPPEDVELGPNGTRQIEELRGEIEFKNVTMGYDRKHPVLHDVNIKIQAGLKVGLAGRTGSGKTTTLGLLARLYEFNQGEILIDGVPIRQLDRYWLRSNIGYVSQDVVIFKGTLKENLSFGSEISLPRIHDAVQSTGLARVLESRNLSLDSELLEAGANLSHGERQLLALTRVLLKNPRLLVLDEATANIDPGFELLIHKAVDALMQGRTCFMIAHRLDTLKNCDQILVFKEGRICERGSIRELLDLNGYFAELLRSSEPVAAPQSRLEH
jgi:ATP-binding cassette, subfamily B, multidrug efflux pump